MTPNEDNPVYSIETANKPLVFRVKEDSVTPGQPPSGNKLAQKVEVRSLPGMQKEAIVTAVHPQAGLWRIVCDEGPYLNGSDLAPFPLAFYTAGLQFCLLSRLQETAKARDIQLQSLKLELDNWYTMKGSFIKGDAVGGAKPADVYVQIESDAAEAAIADLINSAVSRSPGQAVMRDVLNNAFSLRLNGKKIEVSGLNPAQNPIDPDPGTTTFQTFASEADDAYLSDIITKTKGAQQVHGVAGGASSSLQPVQDRTLHVHGEARVLDGTLKETDIQLRSPIGSNFHFLSDDNDEVKKNRAPSGLAYLSAGVGFCYMTQLSRFAHIKKLDIGSIRIVQHNLFSIEGSAADDSAKAAAHPVDTHVFIEANETDRTINDLIRMGEQTCFLHAAMSNPCPSNVRGELNGKSLSL